MNTGNALEILDQRYIAGQPDEIARLEEARLRVTLGELAYCLRENAGLSREEVALRVGVSPDDIDSLEIADFTGDYLALVLRIAIALGRRIVFDTVPAESPTSVAA